MNDSDRRTFLKRITSALVAPALLPISGIAAQNTHRREFFVSAQGAEATNRGVSYLSPTTGRVSRIQTPFRGHGASQHPTIPSLLVMYARRPGTSGVVVNLESGEIEQTFEATNQRHFFGHGCFSQDGKYLYTTEADLLTGQGKIGVRDGLTFKHLGEFDSGGIGPHEIKLMPDGKKLAIANGGILTKPESGRKKLNLDTMRSTLTYANRNNGEIIEQVTVPEPKASIRHLDVTDNGEVVFGMQIQRGAAGHENPVPLGATHRIGEAARLLKAPEALIYQMNDYCGSVAVNSAKQTAGFTSPRGDVVAFWKINDGQFAGYHQLQDVCGITTSADQRYFVVSNSFGHIRQIDAFSMRENRSKQQVFSETHWDNHMIRATL